MKKTLAFLSVALIGSAIAASAQTVAIDFGPDQTTASWSNLSNQNPAFTPDAGSAAGISFSQVGGFPATAGLYGGANYTVQIGSSNAYTDLHAVSAHFSATYMTASTQAFLSYDLDGEAVLSPIAATFYSLVAGTEQVWVDAIGDYATYDQFVYAWDLSGVNGLIENLKIEVLFNAHTSVIVAEANFGSEYNDPTAIPEPSTYALILGGLALGGVAFARRRRA